jgi:hypothetical protein
MEDYMHTFSRKSSGSVNENDIRRLHALFEHDKGIENFRISPDGIYLEYNSYLYSLNQIEEILYKNGFKEHIEKKHGFFMTQIRNLAESNKKTFGDRKPDCCH